MKKTATATANVTSYRSATDAQKLAVATASKDVKAKATKTSKYATNKKALDKARLKITKKVRTYTKNKAYKSALKAAKKAGIK